MAVTVYLSPLTMIFQYLTDLGVILAGGKVNIYIAGTSSAQATYTDSTGVTPNANPIILGSNGRLPNVEIWQPINVKIKAIVTDASNNPVGPTMDQIAGINDPTGIQNTFYGGTDSGSANNYILTFSPGFSAYTNGIVVNWIPNNTNTGASTINMNGLGVINITFINGGALNAGALVAGTLATILISGGNAVLLNAAGTVGSFTNGNFTATVTGCTTAPTKTVTWARAGSLIVLNVPATGTLTSNATSFTMTGLPSNLQLGVGAATVQSAGWNATDNGVNAPSGGSVFIAASSGTLTFQYNNTTWTNSGNKFFGAFTMTYFSQSNFG